MARPSERRVTRPAVNDATITTLEPSWVRALEALNRSPKTIVTYRLGIAALRRWLAAEGKPETVATLTKRDVQAWVAHLLATAKPATARSYTAACKVFFGWCVGEGELSASPLADIRAPSVPVVPPDVLTDDQLRAILRACNGSDFYSRRDAAIFRLLIDCGLRRSEMTNLTLDALDLKANEATVMGKGRRQRTVRYHSKTAAALDRYLRIRERHPDHELPNLWLGRYGALTYYGMFEVVKRRAGAAGVDRRIWPHLFRHTFSHGWLAEGGSEGGLMRVGGWQSRSMLDRYGASVASERARDEAGRLKGGDRL